MPPLGFLCGLFGAPEGAAEQEHSRSREELPAPLQLAQPTRALSSLPPLPAHLRIDWEDLKFRDEDVCGQGACSTVFKGGWQGNRVAIKAVAPDKVSDDARASLYAEAITMSQLQHPYIARVFGVVDDGEHLAMVMQYYRRGNLEDFMHEAKTRAWFDALDMSTRIKMACMVASAMHYMATKSPPLVHGDLKASNLLLDDMMNVYVADFGLARQRHPNSQHSQHSPTHPHSHSSGRQHKQQHHHHHRSNGGGGDGAWSGSPQQAQYERGGGGGGGGGAGGGGSCSSAPTSTTGVSVQGQGSGGGVGGEGGGMGGGAGSVGGAAISEVGAVRKVVSGPLLERAATAGAGGGGGGLGGQEEQVEGAPDVSIHTAAPELVRNPGAPREVSGDVFSFGMVLLQICMGKNPYKGMSPTLVRQLVLEGHRPPIPSSVPPSVAAVVLQCTALDPLARPSFANVVRRLEAAKKELRPILDDTTFMGF